MATKKEKIKIEDFFDQDKIYITDQNLIFQEVKFWKKIYTSINLTEGVILKGNSEKNKVEIIFNKNSDFYYIVGEIDNPGNCLFIEKLIRENSQVYISLNIIKSITKILKAELRELHYFKNPGTGNQFYTIRIIDSSDGLTKSFASVFSNKEAEIPEEYHLTKSILETLEYSNNIPENYLENDDIFEIYINNKNEISNEKSDEFNEKLIEIARKRIKSLLSKSTENILLYSNVEENNSDKYRYIGIKSYSDSIGLSLTQLFLVIV